MIFEIENTEAQNLKVINTVLNAMLNFEVHSLNEVERILNVINPEGYIWGRSGSHIWLSQEDGKRIIIFK